MAAQTFVLTTSFGVSQGPTYGGSTSVPPGVDGTETKLYALNVPHGSSPLTVDAAGITKAQLNGLGFLLNLVAANGNLTPTATVTLVGAGVGGADISLPLAPGQTVAFALGDFLTADATSITITPDATADLYLYGIQVENNV